MTKTTENKIKKAITTLGYKAEDLELVSAATLDCIARTAGVQRFDVMYYLRFVA